MKVRERETTQAVLDLFAIISKHLNERGLNSAEVIVAESAFSRYVNKFHTRKLGEFGTTAMFEGAIAAVCATLDRIEDEEKAKAH